MLTACKWNCSSCSHHDSALSIRSARRLLYGSISIQYITFLGASLITAMCIPISFKLLLLLWSCCISPVWFGFGPSGSCTSGSARTGKDWSFKVIWQKVPKEVPSLWLTACTTQYRGNCLLFLKKCDISSNCCSKLGLCSRWLWVQPGCSFVWEHFVLADLAP